MWPSLISGQEPSVPQLQNLSACIDLTQALFENFFSLPPGDVVGVPFPIYIQMRLGLGILFCLSTLDCPGWDKSTVRRQIDPLDMIDGMISAYEGAKAAHIIEHGTEESGDGLLSRISGHLRLLR